MGKTHDLRVQKTRNSIRGQFIQLIKTKPVNKITVTELASLAQINKGTFYLHYPDIYEKTMVAEELAESKDAQEGA